MRYVHDGTRHIRSKKEARTRGIANAIGSETSVQMHRNVRGMVPLTKAVNCISLGANREKTTTLVAVISTTKIANPLSIIVAKF